MSAYEELRQFVAIIAGDAQNDALRLVTCAENVEKYAAAFTHLTATTAGSSAKAVEVAFHSAQKQILIAANALLEAAKAGAEWSGSSVPELNLVLRPKSR